MLCTTRTSAVAVVAPRRLLVPVATPVPLRSGRSCRPTTIDIVPVSERPHLFTRPQIHACGTKEANDGLKVNPLIPDFTRRREVFTGRLAMFGYFAACFWEWFFPSHPGIISQVVGFGQEAGLPISPSLVGSLFGGIIVYNAISALFVSQSQDNQRDVAKRDPRPVVLSPTDWGFTKANELLHGRIAMLGFLGVLLNQLRLGGYTGPGPLAQVAYLLGVPADGNFYSLVPGVFVAWTVLATTLAYINGKPGPQEERGIQ